MLYSNTRLVLFLNVFLLIVYVYHFNINNKKRQYEHLCCLLLFHVSNKCPIYIYMYCWYECVNDRLST